MSQRYLLKQLFRFAIPLALLLPFVSCSSNDSQSKSSPAVFQLPWPDENGRYQLRDVKIKTLTQPRKLIGQAAKITVQSRYTDEGLKHGQPNFRILKNGSRYIPGNVLSLQAATVYAHIERLQELDQNLEIAKHVSRPRKIGVDTEWATGRGKQLLKNNAIYDGGTDSMIIVPYDKKDLPIVVNAGVIAHEYSHAVFNALVRKPLQDHYQDKSFRYAGGHLNDSKTSFFQGVVDPKQAPKKPQGKQGNKKDPQVEDGNGPQKPTVLSRVKAVQFNIELIMRAADEGLADFWAWIYTGDEQFMGRSLPSLDKDRRIDSLPKSIKGLNYYLKRVKSNLKNKKSNAPEAYKLGTQYARFLRDIARDLGYDRSPEGRQKMGELVVAALSKYSGELINGIDKHVSPYLILQTVLQSHPDLAKKHCSKFQRVVPSGSKYKFKGCAE